MDDNNPDKNDRKDPKTIAALVNEGRFSYPYIPTGVYAEIRSLSNLRFRRRKRSQGSGTGLHDGSVSIFPNIKTFMGNWRQ